MQHHVPDFADFTCPPLTADLVEELLTRFPPPTPNISELATEADRLDLASRIGWASCVAWIASHLD